MTLRSIDIGDHSRQDFLTILDISKVKLKNGAADVRKLFFTSIFGNIQNIQWDDNAEIVRGFFEACYIRYHQDNSKKIIKTADKIFDAILQKSLEAETPSLYVAEEMYRALMKCWFPNWDDAQFERHDFMSRKHFEHLLNMMSYADQKLKQAMPGLDKHMHNELVYALGLTQIASLFPSPTDDLMKDVACFRFQKKENHEQNIDQKIALLSDPQFARSIPATIKAFRSIEAKINEDLNTHEAGKVRQELLAIALDDALWLPIEQQGDSHIEELLEKIENTEGLDLVDAAVGRYILAQLCKKCAPSEIGDSFFRMIIQQNKSSDTEAIRAMCSIYQIDDSGNVLTDLYNSLTAQKYSREDICGIISAICLITGSQFKLEEIMVDLCNANEARRNLDDFYSGGMEAIAEYVIQQMQDQIREACAPQSSLAEKFMRSLKANLDTFNVKRVQSEMAALLLSPYELYAVAAAVFEKDCKACGIAAQPMIPSCPTTVKKAVELIEKSFKQHESQLNRDEINQILARFNDPDHTKAITDEFNLYLLEREWEVHQKDVVVEIKSLEQHFANEAQKKDDPNRISVQLNPEIVVSDLTLGITTSEAKQQNKPLRHVEKYQQASQVIEGFEQQYNESAANLLLQQMLKNPKVKPHVWQEYEKNWQNGDKSLYGDDIVNGKALLTEQRRAIIMQAAEHLSSVLDMNAALAEFKRTFNRDIAQGKVVAKTEVVQKRYPGFFGFIKKKLTELTKGEQKEWQEGYDKIVADALVQQEMKKLLINPDRSAGTFVESALLALRKLGNADDLALRAHRNKAEVEVLKTMMEGKGVVGRDLSQIKAKVDQAKLEARLKASRVKESEIAGYVAIIQTMEAVYDQLLAEVKPFKEDFKNLPADYPKQHRQAMLERKAARMDYEVKELIQQNLKSLDVNFLLGQKPEEIIKTLIKKMEPSFKSIKDGELSKSVESRYTSSIAFHKKWGHRIVCEMIQGLADKQEDFLSGVCAAIAGRWAVNDQLYPHAKAADLGNPEKLKITAIDRVRQGIHAFACAVSHLIKDKIKGKKTTDPDEAQIEMAFPKPYRDGLGIKKVDILSEFFTKSGLIPDQFKEQLNRLQNKLKDSRGVIPVSLKFDSGGHRIYLRCDKADPKALVFRLGEPNIGLMQFPDEKELIECFTDLCQIMYDDKVRYVRIWQFTL